MVKFFFTLGMAKGIEFIYIRFMAQIWVDCTILKFRKKYDCSFINEQTPI